jgi:ribosomal protein S18 acetylase RimI-like enzyme
MSVAIRQWTTGDLPAVRQVTWDTWLDAYSSFIPESDLRIYFDAHYNLEALTQLFHTPLMNGFVAEVDGSVVGYVKTKFNKEENRFYVSSLYILPKCQGMGLGGKLMAASEELAKALGADATWLGVMTQNTPALDWYKRHGFTFVEEAPFTMGQTTVVHLIGFRKIRVAANALQ